MDTAPENQPVIDAYLEMADRAKYRPAHFTDGFGGFDPETAGPVGEEAQEYLRSWLAQEGGDWRIGVPNFPYLKAMVFAIEGARLCCSSDGERAKLLLQMAAEAIAPRPERYPGV